MTKYINYKLIVSLLLVFGSFQMQAQNEWDGDNAIGRFTFCDNWFANTCPGVWNATTDLIIQLKNNGSQTTMFLDYGAWRDINNLIYSATYTSSVTQFDADGPVFNENGLNFYGKIENYSPNLTQVFNLPFHGRNATRIELNPINGGLTFNRTIFNSGNRNFEVYGPNSRKVTLNGYPEGNNTVGFYIKENSIVEVNYNNVASLSGGYFVERGELWIEALGVIQGGIQVGLSNANVNKLYISNPSVATTVANAITVPDNSTNATIGSLNTSNTHTYSGTINLNNNNVNFDVVSAGGTVNFTNTISGTGGILKINPGLVRLSAANTYTGNTTINSGTLQYGVADAIANTSNVILNGGTFSTGAVAGFSDTVGTLALTANSTIALGTGNHILAFAASNSVSWTFGQTLTITGWTNSCTGAKVFVGSSSTGLTAAQLAQITFQGYPAGAKISPVGELIPNNVILTATLGTLLGSYSTLSAAFTAMNASIHTGNIFISVLNDINEGIVTATLNNNAAIASVLIQPAGCGPRTISGATTAGNPLIDFNGADNVTVDGLNTNGNSLTISNTTISATSGTCTIRFQTDATGNTITNSTVLGSATMAAGAAGGNIWFGANATLGGNDNNTISNCNIGPAGANLSSKAIYFSGTIGVNENNGISITNNNIYDFFSATVASTGIDLGTMGSNNVSITNNRFYQTATRTQTIASIHSCIRIVNNAGLFTITGNTIGYSSSAGTGTYNFVGIAGSIFNPITLSVGTAAASSLQNNTIAGISHTTSSGGFTNLFNAIIVNTGSINIGTITGGNTIGLPAAPITFNATAGQGGIAFGITTTSAATVNIQYNTIQSISGIGVANAAFDFTGINIAGSAASTYTVSNNTIGNAVAANSINLGVLGTSTAFSTFRGINSAALGSVTIGSNGFPNLIQNIALNANAPNVFIGISNTAANTATNIRYNNIRGIRFASVVPPTHGSTFTGIINSGAVNGPLNITNNNLGILGTDLITYAGACSGLFRGIVNTAAGAAAALSITSNDIRGVTHSVAGNSNHTYISNTAACPTHTINLNTITGSTSTSGTIIGIADSSASANKTIANNAITALTSTGNLVTAISSSNGTAVSIGTNTISNISSTSATASSIVSGISVTGGATISITNNPISTLTSANDGSFRGIYVNPLGATSNTISGNTINGMTSTSTGTGFSVRAIEVQGTANANISSNTVSSINSPTTNVPVALTGTPIVGIYYGSSGAASTINGNTISSLNATAITLINVPVAAIVTASIVAGGIIAKNRIYGLTNTTTGATNAAIGFLPNGGNWTFANNMISITNNNTVRAIGVFDVSLTGTGTRNYYYNSIYIGGTHAGTQVSTAFQFNALAGATADIKNNILVMERVSPGKNYAFANSSANFNGITTDYNVLNSTVASTIGLTNTTDRDFAAWKTASSGDMNSYSGIAVPFTNTAIADLHIVAGCTDIESGGTPLSVLDDYDSTARNATTPDIGADEFMGTRPADITLTPNSPLCLGSSISLNATSTDLTYVYTWTPATGLSATTGATVTASPIVTTTYTVTGTAPSSCVKLKEVTITVNPTPAAISVSPNTAAICPNAIQAFTASPNTGIITVGVASGTSLAETTPYRQTILISSQNRVQYLITRAELNATGLAGGNITSLGFNVQTVGNPSIPNYAISMANTSDTALNATFISSGFTTVFNGTLITPVFGLNTHTFQTPFAWDGVSNIVINVCHDSGSSTGTLSGVAVSNTPVAMSNSRSGAGGCALVSSIAGTNTIRPVITLGFENPITWSPITELYTDATVTTVYNPLVHLNQPTIYSKSSIARVYNATLTTVGTGCTRTSTGTITFSGSTWDGTSWSPSVPAGNSSLTFTGNYTSSGNLSGCSCTVTGGNVVFNGPHALILDNSLTVTAPGTIKFNNSSSLVQIDDTATNTGIITMERITPPIYRFDYTYWGTPVTLSSNFTLGLPLPSNGLSPDTLADKFFSWTPTIANGPGNWFFESASTVMNPIKGYIVRGPQTYSFTSGTKIPYTANFIGTPNNGVISCPIYHGTLASPDDRDDWNLLGNPYPSAVNALSFLSNPLNTPIIDGTIYFWTHNSDISSSYLSPFYGTFLLNYNNSDYATWNRVGAVGSAAGTGGPVPGGFIAAGQGFFTKSTGTAPSGNSVIFNNSMRVAGSNSQFYRMAFPPHVPEENNSDDPIERQRLWLNLSDESGAFNQILIGYVEGATLGWDRAFDSVRLTDQTSATLYSNLEDKKLVIQGRPLPFDENDEVPLGYRVNISGNNTFAIDRVDDSFSGQNIYIEDRVLDIVHNLRVSPYTFATEAGTFNDRFVLRYTDASLSANEFEVNQNVTAFIFSNELQVKSSKNIVAIEVFDISGKLIQKYQPMELALEFKSRFNFAQGVYLAKIKLDNGIEVTKKVIH